MIKIESRLILPLPFCKRVNDVTPTAGKNVIIMTCTCTHNVGNMNKKL